MTQLTRRIDDVSVEFAAQQTTFVLVPHLIGRHDRLTIIDDETGTGAGLVTAHIEHLSIPLTDDVETLRSSTHYHHTERVRD